MTRSTYTCLRKQIQINILPNHSHTYQHAFTINVYHLMFQGDISQTTIYEPVHKRRLTTKTSNTIPTTPTTTTYKTTNTYKVISEVNSIFPTTFFENASHKMFGNSVSQNTPRQHYSETALLQTVFHTQPSSPLPRLLLPTTSTSSRCFRSTITTTLSTI